MRSFTSRATGSSSAVIRCGAKSGSRILRYVRWAGGSICSGISGRSVFRSWADMFDENAPGSRRTWSTPARDVTTTPTPSTRRTGELSWSIAYVGCGFLASSGLISSASAWPSVCVHSVTATT
jgi:hypothetical protein